MEKSLEVYNLPRLNQEVIENMNRPVTSKEVESVTKNLPIKKSLGPGDFTGEFYQSFKEESIPILPKHFQKVEEGGTLPNTHVMRPVLL